MSFTQLLLYAVTFLKSVRVARSWVSEDETCHVQNANFVTILEFATLVTTDNRIIYKRSINGQVLKYANTVTAASFRKGEAMSV